MRQLGCLLADESDRESMLDPPRDDDDLAWKRLADWWQGLTTLEKFGSVAVVATLVASGRIVVVALDRAILDQSLTLTTVSEMHDRLIVATALSGQRSECSALGAHNRRQQDRLRPRTRGLVDDWNNGVGQREICEVRFPRLYHLWHLAG